MDRDFTGFNFGGVSSEELGITRVSSGDRYEEQLHPEIKDITAEVPGLNGNYYFGSSYGPKSFDVEFAFDHLTETQFRKLRQVFGTKQIQKLIFNERPYKYYMAKIESPIELSYVCFNEPKRVEGSTRNGVRRNRSEDEQTRKVQVEDSVEVEAGETVSFTLQHVPPIGTITVSPEGEYPYDNTTYTYTFTNESDEPITFTISYKYEETYYIVAWEQVTPWEYTGETERIYKGEGKVTFICYFPFAKSVYKILPDTTEDNFGNVEDWASSSGILSNEDYSAYSIDIYNSRGLIPRLKEEEEEKVSVDSINEAVFLSQCDSQGEYTFTCELQIWYLNETRIGTSGDLEENYGVKVTLNDFNASFTIEVTEFIGFRVYNAGDISTGFRLYCPFTTSFGMKLTYYLFENEMANIIKHKMGVDSGI